MTQVFSKRFLAFPAVLIAGFTAIVTRVFYLYSRGQSFVRSSIVARRTTCILPAKRGKILDRNGCVLAITKRVYEVGVDLTCTSLDDRKKLPDLSHYVGLPPEQLSTLWTNREPKKWKKLSDDVDEESYEALRGLKIAGVYGNPKDRRIYIGSRSLGIVIGVLNNENTPIFGVEKLFDFYLRGQDGICESERDGHRKELMQFRTRNIPCRDGCDVQLTLDANIQAIVEKTLEEAYTFYRPLSIQAVVTNPRTGALLAIVTIPTFDPNHFGNYPIETLKNRTVTDVYEPGSVFKIVTVGAALNEGVVTPETTFDCSKTTAVFRKKTLSLPGDWKPFNRVMSVSEILSNSSNRGVAQIALALGPEKLHHYARLFGFGEKTESCFSGESRGLLPHWKKWDNLTLTRLPMGHGLACTLLQMHYALSVVANEGQRQLPFYVQRVFNPNGDIVRSFSPRTERRILSRETADTLCTILLHGPASKAYIKGYNVAGKTGTTQKIINHKYSHNRHISSFSGFFPHRTRDVHISLTVDSPQFKGTAYGAQVAAPIFKKMAETIVQYLGLPPEPQLI